MRPTICDIAKRLGVSHATVSRALNNRLYVNEETRKRVLEVARELNYKPNVVARALASQKTNLVGVIVPNISVRLYYECSKGIEAVLDKHGLRALVFSSEDDEARFMAYIALLEEQRVDGIILAPGCLDSMHLVRRIEELERTGVPVVIADSPLPQRNLVQIVIDDLYGAYLATRHLLELRRRKIAHICGPKEDFDAIQRLNGFKRALFEFGLNPDASSVSYAKGSTWQDGYVATRNMLEHVKQDYPDAIFAFNDYHAIGAMKALEEMNLVIPGDIALVGYGDEPFSAFPRIDLTTVAQPGRRLGAQAATRLIEVIDGVGETAGMVPPTLVIRGTSGKKIE